MEPLEEIRKLTDQFATLQSGIGAAAVALQMARDLIDLLYQEIEQLTKENQTLRSAQEKPVLQ